MWEFFLGGVWQDRDPYFLSDKYLHVYVSKSLSGLFDGLHWYIWRCFQLIFYPESPSKHFNRQDSAVASSQNNLNSPFIGFSKGFSTIACIKLIFSHIERSHCKMLSIEMFWGTSQVKDKLKTSLNGSVKSIKPTTKRFRYVYVKIFVTKKIWISVLPYPP